MAESYSLEAVLSVVDQGFTQAMERAGNATESLSSKAKSSSAGIGAMSLAFGAAQLGVKAFTAALGMVTGSIDGAVNRIDTLNNSERVFKNMGFEAGETAKMMDNLNDSITGLPTPLDSAVKGVQLIASSTNDLLKSEQIFSAMNNAILGFGGSADMVDNAIVQLSQSFSNGKIDAQTWNSMINSGMGPSLTALAKTMNMTMGEFKAGLSDGTISVEEFQDALITLNEEGGGGLASLQQIAQDATGGIKTSLANMRTAIVRGVANIISSIDEGLAGAGLMTIGEMISAFGKAMNTALTQVGNVLGVVIPKAVAFISMLVGPLQEVTGLFGALTPSAEAAGAAIEQVAMSAEELSAIADSWNDLSLDEKQATVDTMGQEDLEQLLELLGVDFDSIPDEYTKNAFLNAYGADALEELLWVTGTWHDLTLEEKRAVLEAQIDNEELAQAIETMGMWEDAEFYSKLADINMNDNGAEQQVLDLINQWAELNGLEPVEIEVNAETKPAEKAIDKFAGAYKKFGKSIGKITKGIGKIVEKTGELFEPAFDFLGDLSKSSLKMLGGYVDATGKLFEGDWSGAWDTFKDATKEGLISVAGSLKTNMPRVWENITGVVDNILEWAGRVDWGAVGTTIMSGIGTAIGTAVNSISDVGTTIFTYITKKVEAVNWSEVGEDIGKWVGDALQKGLDAIKNFDYTKLNAMFAALGEMIDTLGLALLKLAAGALVGLAKSFGFEKEMEAITQLLDDLGNIDFNGDFDHIAEQIRQAFQDAFKGWDLNDWMPKLEWQWDKKNWQFDWATGEVFEVDVETGARVFITEAEIQDMVWSNLLNEADKLGLIEYDADGNVVINADTEFNPDFTHIDQQALVDQIAEQLGVPTVQLKVKTEFNQADIDKEFGEGSYDIYTEAEVKVDAYLEKGYADAQIESLLKSVMTDEQYEMYLDIKGFMDSFTVDPSATTEADSQVKAAFSGKEETEVEVPVRLSPTFAGGSGKQGAATGAVGGGLSGGGLADGILGQLATDVQTAMASANEAITAGATAMQTALQAGYTQMSIATQTFTNQLNVTILSGMTRMVASGTMGTTLFNVAFRSGLNQAVITAQNIVNSIVNAFSGLASRMHSAGVQAGQGFNQGLASQEGSIVGTANRIAQSVSKTIQSALDIHSPSRLLAWLGRMAITGLVKGMEAMVSVVQATSNQIALASVPDIYTPSLVAPSLSSGFSRNDISQQSTSVNSNSESLLNSILDAINRGQVIQLDSGALIGGTIGHIDRGLSHNTDLRGRHRL